MHLPLELATMVAWHLPPHRARLFAALNLLAGNRRWPQKARRGDVARGPLLTPEQLAADPAEFPAFARRAPAFTWQLARCAAGGNNLAVLDFYRAQIAQKCVHSLYDLVALSLPGRSLAVQEWWLALLPADSASHRLRWEWVLTDLAGSGWVPGLALWWGAAPAPELRRKVLPQLYCAALQRDLLAAAEWLGARPEADRLEMLKAAVSHRKPAVLRTLGLRGLPQADKDDFLCFAAASGDLTAVKWAWGRGARGADAALRAAAVGGGHLVAAASGGQERVVAWALRRGAGNGRAVLEHLVTREPIRLLNNAAAGALRAACGYPAEELLRLAVEARRFTAIEWCISQGGGGWVESLHELLAAEKYGEDWARGMMQRYFGL